MSQHQLTREHEVYKTKVQLELAHAKANVEKITMARKNDAKKFEESFGPILLQNSTYASQVKTLELEIEELQHQLKQMSNFRKETMEEVKQAICEKNKCVAERLEALSNHSSTVKVRFVSTSYICS